MINCVHALFQSQTFDLIYYMAVRLVSIACMISFSKTLDLLRDIYNSSKVDFSESELMFMNSSKKTISYVRT